MIINLIKTLVLLLITSKSFAYPQFVGYGYTSCVTCHYNPFGGGSLNDYGRALSATAVSARWFEHDYTTEEEIAERSGFLRKKNKNTWFRPSFDYRGLLLKRDYREESEDTEWINMMADLNIVLKNKTNKYFASFTLAYAPTPSSLESSGQEVDNYRWREAYIGYRIKSSLGIYAGLMDKLYGIRVSEHTNFSRSFTNLSHNDQAHGVQVHYSNSKVEAGANVFLGNLGEEAESQQKGFSAKADYIIAHKATIGASVLKSKSEFLDVYMMAFQHKSSLGSQSAILAEYGQIKETVIATNEESRKDYGFFQTYLNASRGIFFINSLEYLKEHEQGNYRLRFGPGIQMFPMQRLEVRIDLMNARNFSDDGSTRDTWDLLGQVHLWF